VSASTFVLFSGAARELSAASSVSAGDQGLRKHTGGKTPSTFFGLSMTGGMTGGLEPWPAAQFGGIRLWDSGVPWYVLNPSQGVYDWTIFDTWMSLLQQHGGGKIDVLYTFGDVPSWASSAPNDEDCAGYPPNGGGCDPPNDLNPDGSGTNQHWKDFVTAIASHAAGHVHYWEIWNEASNSGQKGKVGVGLWKGTVAQMVRMAQDARGIIRSVDSTAVILSPSTRINIPNDNVWLHSYLAAGGGKYADVVAFHGYLQMDDKVPVPEDLIPDLKTYRKILKQYKQAQKPLFDTEASWGITQLSGLKDPDEQAGFVSRLYLMHRKENVQRFYWYEWDNGSLDGTLWSPADLVVANGSGGTDTANVLLGFGNGKFLKPAAYTVGSDPSSAASGTFCSDPELACYAVADLAVTNAGDGTVSVLLGNGDGTFQNAVPYSVGNNPTSIAVGDFNGDHAPDLVVTNGADNTVSVLLGNGDGTFQTAKTYATEYTPASVTVGDFDHNGMLDLAVANSCGSDPACKQVGTVSVLLGNGDGTFQSAVDYSVGKSPVSVATGDFNGDGKLDLVVANKLDSTVSVLLGNGDGTFQAAATYATDTTPTAVAVGHFNGYSKPEDLAVACAGKNDVSVLTGKGDGTFNSYVPYKVGSRPFSVEAADFTGNGIIDLVVANENSANVSVLLGNGDGTFQEPPVTSAAGSTPVGAAVGNFKAYGSSSPGTLLKPGCAYQTTYSWLVGNTLAKSCAAKASVWTCDVNGPKGYQAQAVWDTSQSCSNGVCTFSKYTLNPKFIQYETVYGQVVQVNGSTVPIGYRPILLENQNPSRTQTSCPGEWLGVP